MPSVLKIGRWLYKNGNKSPKILYSAMAREVEKWSGICIRERIATKS